MIIKSSSVQSKYSNLYSLSTNEVYFPIFQRGFSWKPIQTEKIIEDILNNIQDKSKQLYLLDFIWFEEDGKFKLADGQQRLMTFYIIIKCINELIEKESLPISKIQNYNIFYEEDSNQIKFSKFESGSVVAPFKKVYLHIFDFVKHNKHQIQDIIDVITSNVFVFLKKADNVDDAFEIFKQINTGGKPLSKDEIIKTIISQYSSKYSIPITSSLKDIRKLIISYHKYVNGDKSNNFDSIGIMSFLNKQIVNSKKNFSVFSNYLQIVSTINKLSIYHIASYINRGQIIDIIYILGIKGIDLNIQRDYMTRILLPLCLMSIIMTTKKVNPGGIVLSLYSTIIEMIKNDNSIDEIENFILTFVDENKQICKTTLTEFNEAIGDPELSQNIKKALLIIDIVKSNTSGSLNVDSINLEHIYPKSPVTTWATNGWPVNRDEQKQIINNIGNMILLNQEINKKIQNKFIDDKIVEYNRIIPKDRFLQTSMNTFNFNKFKIEKDLYIKNRQSQISDSVKNDFYFGKVLIQ